jgi:GNAT superfamily N-acetyltransferase
VDSGITLALLDGRQAAGHTEEIAELSPGDGFARRFPVHRRQPGFVLAEARHGEFLVGYAYGAPLRQSTSWWRDLSTPLPEDVTTEYPGRTFALLDLAVRAAWRRQGIGRDLYDLLMTGRPEERATAIVPSGAAAARQAFTDWGWTRVARTNDGTVLLLSLPR